MAAYYNEFDPKAAAWLRELIKAGLIADGVVDERSITEVRADDLVGFAQCHFFAGIGGWSYALRLAGIPDDYPVWSGSCPCQPFSVAGKSKGKDDDRHLWPAFYYLIQQCRPVTVFGEQVEGAVKHGWLDDLQANLEAEGYAVGAAVLGAHSVGSFHQRQRLYWVANSNRIRRDSGMQDSRCKARERTRTDCRCADNGGMADVPGAGSLSGPQAGIHCREKSAGSWNGESERYSPACGVADNGGQGHKKQPSVRRISRQANDGVARENTTRSGSLGNSEHYGSPSGAFERGDGEAIFDRSSGGDGSRQSARNGSPRIISAEWSNPNWIECRDNKIRPVKRGIKPLVDGLPRGMVYSGGEIDPNNTGLARALRLKGYGNAIVPQVAAEFIGAFFDIHAGV